MTLMGKFDYSHKIQNSNYKSQINSRIQNSKAITEYLKFEF